MMWTKFWDMNSGGRQKEPYSMIYIESESEEQAQVIFYNKFRHSAERVTCTCCGEDYSVSSDESLEELTRYHRTNSFEAKDGERTLDEYVAREDVLVVRAADIDPNWKTGSVPRQGYVWQD